jgi:hypothetical protein
MKINIGCGPNGQLPEFINLDNSRSIWLSRFPWLKKGMHRVGLLTDAQLKDDWRGVVRYDVSRRLLYPEESVSKIYSSHFLEHIPYLCAVNVLKECHRVLRRDGTMRLVVPDLLWHAERYVQRTREFVSAGSDSDGRRAHDEFMETICGAYLNRRRYGAAHCYMYDYPTLLSILRDLGFRHVKPCPYREGDDQELASFDSRPGESLHLEIRKEEGGGFHDDDGRLHGSARAMG